MTVLFIADIDKTSKNSRMTVLFIADIDEG